FKTCPFCDWPKVKKDLIIAETANYYLTVNEFPYTEHHLLIAPFNHVTSLTNEPISTEKEELSNLGGKIMTALGITNYVVLDRSGRKSGRSLAHIHRHIIPVDGPHDMFYRFADIRSDWNKKAAAKNYRSII